LFSIIIISLKQEQVFDIVHPLYVGGQNEKSKASLSKKPQGLQRNPPVGGNATCSYAIMLSIFG